MCDLLFSSFLNQTLEQQKIKTTAYEIENVQIINLNAEMSPKLEEVSLIL